jgi:microcystin-dependent protein
MADPYLGEIRMFCGNYAPNGWAFCNGQLLIITQNQALFSILGTTFGGDGHTTFALPNLQGRVPMHWGQGAGLSPYSLGQSGGSENVTLQAPQMPAHTHVATTTISANAQGTSDSPSGAVPGGGSGSHVFAASADATKMNAAMASTHVQPAGSSHAHPNIQPFLCVSFIIALQGIYPSPN